MWSERSLDRRIALLFFAVSALARIPFTGTQLFHRDSYGLAAGVLYTLTAHPPGFIGYCAVVRAVYWLAGDVNLSFVIVNVLATGAATALTYLVARELFDRHAGIIAAVLYASSLATSYFAGVALSYAAEGACATAVALTGWIALRRRSFAWLLGHCAVLAIGGSVRQTTLAFLLPLWFWIVWRSVPRWRQRIAALLVLGLLVSLWSAPNAERLAKYWDQADVSYFESVYKLQVAMEQFYDASTFGRVEYEASLPRFHWPLVELGVAAWNAVDPPSADAPREVRVASASHALRLIRYQTAKLLFYVVLAMGCAIAFLLLAVLHRRVRASLDADRWLFLALWILPAALFYALNHFGTWGYLLLFLAALTTLAARAITVLFPTSRERLRITIALATINVALFLFLRPLPETSDRNRLLNIALLQYGAPSIRTHFARARSSAFDVDPRQLQVDCVTDDCLIRDLPPRFGLPRDLPPVQPLFR